MYTFEDGTAPSGIAIFSYTGWLYKNSIIVGYINNGRKHGQWRQDNGSVGTFYYNNDIIPEREIFEIASNLRNITTEERLLIKLKWGIECLPK